jgi:membrane carboxypeptidase/penicillin-binding protein
VVALPIWLGYMERVLAEYPVILRSVPEGIVAVPTGPLAGESTKMVPEYFYREAVPPPEVLQPLPPPVPSQPAQPASPQQTNPPA